MRAKKSKASGTPTIKPATKMPVIHPYAAGIDVGSVEHYVCVPPDAVPEGESAVRSFGGFTGELDKLVEWLQHCGVRTVAMESTGVYWIPLAQKLEAAGLETVLANARHLRQVPGRKTDVKDCQWLQQLHSYGLIQGSFRPAQDICGVRSLMRHRQNLAQHCGQQVQHMQKALQEMNVHLHHGARGQTLVWVGKWVRPQPRPAATASGSRRCHPNQSIDRSYPFTLPHRALRCTPATHHWLKTETPDSAAGPSAGASA